MNHNFQVASTRWCPTAEQIMILEEIYRGGMRTPKAYQIEQITSHLSLYGKIECKNVFYWFQNHKARERQKLRRMFNIPRYSQNPSVPPWVSAHGLLTQFHPQEIVLKEASLLSKLEKIHKEERENSTVENGSDTTTLMETDDVHSVDRYRSLKTLELFPTKSTGNLKNEGMQ